ncbi:MAG: sensor histidine kinase [Clostridiaceae bacterium]|nr:sensor histidine kinase [Clostridiaceae bacterium]
MKFRYRYINAPLNLQINIVISAIILIAVILITTLTYFKTLSYTKNSFKNNGSILLLETSDKINARLKLVENTVLMISNDARIQNYETSNSTTNESEINTYLNSSIDFNKYSAKQNGINYENNLIDDIIFSTSSSTIIARRVHFTSYNIKKELVNKWFIKAENNIGKLTWTDYFYNGSAEDILTNNSGDLPSQLNQFMLIRYIFNPSSFKKVGFVAASINLKNLSGLIDNVEFEQSGAFYIIDENGRIIASKNSSDILSNMNFDAATGKKMSSGNYLEGNIGNQAYMVFHQPLAINNWQLVITVPKNELQKSISGAILSVIIIGIMCFLLILVISTLILKNLSSPLNQIIELIKRTRKGNLSNRVEVTGCMEVSELSTEFNFMLERINILLEKILEEQKVIVQAELRTLRAQINPHFLYNTLDSIKWLVLSSDDKKATEIVSALSTFFRLGLSGGNEEIPIKDEIEHVRQYLFIQKLRYGEKLDYLIDIDGDLELYKTPKLILQPIIENAIYHGLNKTEGEGFIKIIVTKTKDNISFEITDNGIGMTEVTSQKLNAKINEYNVKGDSDGHGYAIKNVNQRIKLSYGDEYGINYNSKYEVGTKVTLKIPIIKQ